MIRAHRHDRVRSSRFRPARLTPSTVRRRPLAPIPKLFGIGHRAVVACYLLR